MNHVITGLDNGISLLRDQPLSKPKARIVYEHWGRPSWAAAGWQLTVGCNWAGMEMRWRRSVLESHHQLVFATLWWCYDCTSWTTLVLSSGVSCYPPWRISQWSYAVVRFSDLLSVYHRICRATISLKSHYHSANLHEHVSRVTHPITPKSSDSVGWRRLLVPYPLCLPSVCVCVCVCGWMVVMVVVVVEGGSSNKIHSGFISHNEDHL